MIRRPWSKEVIYFLLVDRFHDGQNREVVEYEASADWQKEKLMKRHGGNFKGVISQLAYIKGLGCTTIWLSPVFENYEKDYHGYAITDFLNTDPRFGTVEELKELVSLAHSMGIRIVLDIVINHTASTWTYGGEQSYYNYSGEVFDFGNWHDDRYPRPIELRNQAYYRRKGAIHNWDSYPETREGDIFELKKLVLDESAVGREVISMLAKIYCYWIKETNVDGFRLDTVKHINPEAVALFCSSIRDYANYLGKDEFMIFGEAVGGYELIQSYLGAVKTSKGFVRGLDAALDFPMHFVLEDVIKNQRPVSELYKVYRKGEKMLAKRNMKRSDLIVFIDNHDQIGQSVKSRMGSSSSKQEMIAMMGFLFFLYGIPCLYYGTEQFFQGQGNHDCFLREPMFDKEKNISLQNDKTFLYEEISKLLELREKLSLFTEAISEIDQISVNGGKFMGCNHINEVIYWAKGFFGDKLILAYNPQKHEKASICAKLSTKMPRIKNKYEYVYGGLGEVNVYESDGSDYINIDLNPLQFVILK